ncbi:hypothetical protein [Streptomyces sp. NPDC058623]|uniref:hypothetical protein n=1 Tax=Streptomyces sp. NPDC058623 TaxID=3346563 RepID=UPI0036586004
MPPLWTGHKVPSDVPAPRPAALAPAPTPEDLYWAEADAVFRAWDELGLPGGGAEVRAVVAEDLAVLSPQPAVSSVDPAAALPAPTVDSPMAAPTPAPAPVPTPDSAPSPAIPATAAAAAVGEAASEADAHADELKHHPEWQKIQTIRGALANVWDVMKEKAGPAWSRLTNDIRFQGFWKTISIRACEAISEQATALADRLRPGLPSAEALLKLSDATLTYSTVASAGPAPAPAQQAKPDAPEPSRQRLVGRDAPPPYASREEAMQAGQGVMERFQEWIKSPMGQACLESGHARVAAFREAWTTLPPHDGPPGPAVGAYGKVGESAHELLRVAVSSARYAPGDLRALQGLAQAAERHSARLSTTLPPGAIRPTPAPTTPTPQVAMPAATPARTSRASL